MVTVADTAFSIAAVRAEEGARPVAETLFEDPYAHLFAAHGADAAEATQRYLDLVPTASAPASPRADRRAPSSIGRRMCIGSTIRIDRATTAPCLVRPISCAALVGRVVPCGSSIAQRAQRPRAVICAPFVGRPERAMRAHALRFSACSVAPAARRAGRLYSDPPARVGRRSG